MALVTLSTLKRLFSLWGLHLPVAMMLPVCTSLKREQVHRHIPVVHLKGTVRMDGPEMMLMGGSGPLHPHLDHHILGWSRYQ